MEAKDTVIIGASPNMSKEDLLKAQAEISFKAGEEKEHKIMIGVAVDEGNKAYKTGIKEVVEWMRGNRHVRWGGKPEKDMGQSHRVWILDDEDWQTKLKEWGIE